MVEYIERQAAIEALGEEPENWIDAEFDLGTQDQWRWDVEAIKAVPPADVRPVVHGEWISDEDSYPGPGLRNYKCTACTRIAGTWRKGLRAEQLFNFCPNCGADMRSEEETA